MIDPVPNFWEMVRARVVGKIDDQCRVLYADGIDPADPSAGRRADRPAGGQARAARADEALALPAGNE